MSEVLPNDQGSPDPNSDVRPPVSPRVQGITPAWEPTEHIPSTEPLDPQVVEAARGLFLEQGGRSGITGTAERIGSAVGSAQRQMRRGLQLVRRIPASAPAHVAQMEQEILDRAATTLEEIGIEVDGIRQQAAHRLDEWSEEAEQLFQQCRDGISTALPRVREQARRYAEQKPLQTIGAIAGVGFALGVALRLTRRSHRG
jgi:ElaB/YqjD/DUF883 family membrane-anchored ribosome-binding protein